MKKIILLISVICVLTLIYSCKDSLGFDPNVVITSITKDTVTTPTNPPDSAFSVDSLRYNFNEVTFLKRDPAPHREAKAFIFSWPCRFTKKDMVIDTGSKPYISLDWFVESNINYKDYAGSGRVDRIAAFHLVFAKEISQNTLYSLDKDIEHKEWIEVELNSFPDMRKPMVKKSYYGNGQTKEKVNAQIRIIDFDKANRFLKLSLDILLPDDPFKYYYQTKNLSGTIIIFF